MALAGSKTKIHKAMLQLNILQQKSEIHYKIAPNQVQSIEVVADVPTFCKIEVQN